MSAAGSKIIATETTEQGEQVLVPGIPPVTLRERLERLLGAPLRPLKPQKPLKVDLFDEDARNQLDLF
jgi:hypothetical protein